MNSFGTAKDVAWKNDIAYIIGDIVSVSNVLYICILACTNVTPPSATYWQAFPPTSRQIISGDGLTGGGDLSADRTISMGTPSTCTPATANGASGTTHQHALTGLLVKGYYNPGNAGYVVTDTDNYSALGFATTLTADRTATLPTAADNTGRILTVAKLDASAYKVIIDGEGSEQIGPALTFDLYAQYDYVTLVCTGSAWVVVATNGPFIFYTSASDVNIAAASSGTWYNPASHSLSVPAGVWELIMHVNIYCQDATVTNIRLRAGLSTASTGVPTFTETMAAYRQGIATGGTLLMDGLCHARCSAVFTGTTTVYLLIEGDSSAGGGLTLTTTGSSSGPTFITARRIG